MLELLYPSIVGIPLLFIDTAGCDFYESAASDEGSKANSREAALVAIHAKRLIESGVHPAEIAIITPYNLQVCTTEISFTIIYTTVFFSPEN